MSDWTSGNRLTLLENGEAYFPRLFDAIDAASEEVLLETFIWREDRVGRQLQQKLVAAAKRGVVVRALVDGYGTPGLSVIACAYFFPGYRFVRDQRGAADAATSPDER